MTVCFTGHRPNNLPGGYNYYSPKNIELGRELRIIIINLINNGATHFICGGALGVDQIAFMVLQKLKRQGYNISVELAIPYEYIYKKWDYNNFQTLHFQHLKQADKVTFVDTIDFYNPYLPPKTYHVSKLLQRNMYMVNNSDIVVAVFNGAEGGTKRCIEYAKTKSKEIIILDKIFST